MQTFLHICYRIGYNVRRYVQLVRQLADGGARFCTRAAMQDYAVSSLFSRWQKPPTCRGRLWHQQGVPWRYRQGRAAPPTT